MEEYRYNLLIQCIELFKEQHNLSGKDAFRIMEKAKLPDYILKNRWILSHYTDEDLKKDMDEFLKYHSNDS